MASKEEREEAVTKGNEWEVVSLTASAYAAAPGPGPKEGDSESGQDIHGKDVQNDAETSAAMFMSGHFGFPPSVDEALPLGPVDSEIQDENESACDATRLIAGEGKSGLKDEQNVFVEALIPGIPKFDENDITLSAHCTDFDKVKEQSVYSNIEFDSMYSCKTKLVTSSTTGKDCTEHGMDSSIEEKSTTNGDDDVEFPYEAWWKKRVVSLYTHAKEANTFWSICFAAAVMGIVIIGHRWQQDQWQILHKWQFNIKDEKMGLFRGQMYRLKDVIIGGHRRGMPARGNTST